MIEDTLSDSDMIWRPAPASLPPSTLPELEPLLDVDGPEEEPLLVLDVPTLPLLELPPAPELLEPEPPELELLELEPLDEAPVSALRPSHAVT